MPFSACFNAQRNSSRSTPMSWTISSQRTHFQMRKQEHKYLMNCNETALQVLTQIGVTGELEPIPGIVGGDRVHAGQDGSLSQDCIKAIFDTLGSNHITV